MHPDTWYHYLVLPSCRMPFSASRHVASIIRFSHHDGCRLVHPDTWYQLFGLSSCWMPFGAPQHVVSIFQFSHHDRCRLVHPDTWYQLFGLPSCWMPFGAPQHVVSIKCHTPSRRMPIGASRQVGHFFNAIHHHDGCRLVHPAKWDIGTFRGAFVTDAD